MSIHEKGIQPPSSGFQDLSENTLGLPALISELALLGEEGWTGVLGALLT